MCMHVNREITIEFQNYKKLTLVTYMHVYRKFENGLEY